MFPVLEHFRYQADVWGGRRVSVSKDGGGSSENLIKTNVGSEAGLADSSSNLGVDAFSFLSETTEGGGNMSSTDITVGGACRLEPETPADTPPLLADFASLRQMRRHSAIGQVDFPTSELGDFAPLHEMRRHSAVDFCLGETVDRKGSLLREQRQDTGKVNTAAGQESAALLAVAASCGRDVRRGGTEEDTDFC
jgi:hypothetical protein